MQLDSIVKAIDTLLVTLAADLFASERMMLQILGHHVNKMLLAACVIVFGKALYKRIGGVRVDEAIRAFGASARGYSFFWACAFVAVFVAGQTFFDGSSQWVVVVEQGTLFNTLCCSCCCCRQAFCLIDLEVFAFVTIVLSGS
jgi:hypothetical protein